MNPGCVSTLGVFAKSLAAKQNNSRRSCDASFLCVHLRSVLGECDAALSYASIDVAVACGGKENGNR